MPKPLRQLTFDDLAVQPAKPSAPMGPISPPKTAAPLAYVLERSARRRSSIHISVLPDLTVRVVAPIRLSRARIDVMVHAREAWIQMRRDEMRVAQHSRVERRWVSGERLPLLDGQIELRVRPVPGQKRLRATLEDAWLDVRVPDGLEDVEPIRRVIYKWYGIQAYRTFLQRVLHYAPQLGVEPSRVLVRNQSSRWGSCASDGSLRFCWRLILAPQRILDYVVVHELSHIRHPHHQPPFWACVATILPNYNELRAELKRDGDGYRL